MSHSIKFFYCAVLFLIVHLTTIGAQIPVTAEQLKDEGLKYFKEKQYDKAVESYRQSIKLNPNLASAHHGLGSAYNNMGRTSDSLEPLQTAARLDPDNGSIRLSLGVTLANMRRTDEALTELAEAKRLNPNDERIYNMLGNVLSNLGRIEEALLNYKKSLELNSKMAANHHNIGLLMMRLGRFTEAVASLEEALRIEPAYRNARYLLSDAYSRAGRYSDAVDSWTKFMEIVPNGPEALTKRSWNYLYAGERGREAAADARKYLEFYGWKDESSPYLTLMANIGYRQAGMTVEAQAIIIEGAKKCNPDAWVYQIIRYFKGEIGSEELLKGALDNDKKTEAHTYIAMNLLLNRKSGEARTHFEWVKEYGNRSFLEYPLAVEESKRIGL